MASGFCESVKAADPSETPSNTRSSRAFDTSSPAAFEARSARAFDLLQGGFFPPGRRAHGAGHDEESESNDIFDKIQ